jgi:hypothetical protein
VPIIRSRESLSDGIGAVEYQGDKFKFTHVQDVNPFYKYAHEQRKEQGNGFSKDRQFRKIASVPNLVWFEFVKRCGGQPTEAQIRKFLRTEEGKMFTTVEKGI